MTRRLLIVEDEPFVALEIEQIAAAAKIPVVATLHSVAAALEFVKSGAFEAAVLDANLAGSSAAPVAAVLRQRGIPYLVVSGYSRDQLGDLVFEARLLPKPFGVASLLKELSALCQSAHKLSQ